MTRSPLTRSAGRIGTVLVAAAALTGCNTLDRLGSIGEAPTLSPIATPVTTPGYQPVRFPMPAPETLERNPNSLWARGARTFFDDQRAQQIGDLVTVRIEIQDEAEITNSTTRSRASGEEAGLDNFLGFEANLGSILPDEVIPGDLIDFDSNSTTNGSGAISREEEIELDVAAVVTQILPNGNMVIYGRQEIRVNFEVRDLEVAGVIRPEDISNDNTIDFNRIAEARISYGGRGLLTDVQQPRYGQQFYDIVFPF